MHIHTAAYTNTASYYTHIQHHTHSIIHTYNIIHTHTASYSPIYSIIHTTSYTHTNSIIHTYNIIHTYTASYPHTASYDVSSHILSPLYQLYTWSNTDSLYFSHKRDNFGEVDCKLECNFSGKLTVSLVAICNEVVFSCEVA